MILVRTNHPCLRVGHHSDPKVTCLRKDAEGTLWFKDWLVVPKKKGLKKKILDEAHTSRYYSSR
jgi:hypothetical protein